MPRWLMMTGLLGAASFVATEAFAQDNTAAKKKQAAQNKRKAQQQKKKKKADKPDGVGPFKKGEYPLAERLRPLVLPRNMGEVDLFAPIGVASVGGTSTTTFGLGPSFTYGFGMAEVGLSTGFPLAPDADWSRTIVPRVAWLAWDSKEFDFAPGLSIPLAFVEDTSVSVLVDLTSRYVLSDGWFVYFGQGAIPIGVSPAATLGLNVNGGVGWQLNPRTAFTLDLTALSFDIAPVAVASGIWEFFNPTLGVQYTPTREWDVGARVGLYKVWDLDGVAFTIAPYAAFRF